MTVPQQQKVQVQHNDANSANAVTRRFATNLQSSGFSNRVCEDIREPTAMHLRTLKVLESSDDSRPTHRVHPSNTRISTILNVENPVFVTTIKLRASEVDPTSDVYRPFKRSELAPKRIDLNLSSSNVTSQQPTRFCTDHGYNRFSGI